VRLHIRPETLQRDLRKVLAATLHCDAWISSWFSSDHPLSSILISLSSHEAASAAPPFLYDSNQTACSVADLVKSAEPFGLRRHIDELQSILHQ
jgi:hypothetical protein